MGAAIVHVGLAQRAKEARDTATREGVEAIDAGAAVEARAVGAVVDVCLAAFAGVADGTHALEAVVFIHAGSAVQARVRSTLVDGTFTVGSLVSCAAVALVASGSVFASGTVDAGTVGARLTGDLAILSGEAGGTLAHELVVAGVETIASVAARSVGTGVVDDFTDGARESRGTLA